MSETRFLPLWLTKIGERWSLLSFYHCPTSFRKVRREIFRSESLGGLQRGDKSSRTRLGQLKMSNNLKCPKFNFSLEITLGNLVGSISTHFNQLYWPESVLKLNKSIFRFLRKMSNNLKCPKFVFCVSGPPKKDMGYNFLRFIIAPPISERFVAKIFMARA